MYTVVLNVTREKRVRIAEDELTKLKEYRDEEYGSSIPLGFVIAELVEDAN